MSAITNEPPVKSHVKGMPASYATKTPEEAAAYYNKWAETYDAEMVTDYVGPKRLVEFVLKRLGDDVDKNMRILNMGAGSGWDAKEIKKFGFHNIDAVDGSTGMLERAKEQNLYKNYFVELLREDTDSTTIPKEQYDLCYGVGIFNPGHLNWRHLRHFIHAVKPGGRIIFGVSNGFIIEEFRAHMGEVLEGKCKLLASEHCQDYIRSYHNRDGSATFFDYLKI